MNDKIKEECFNKINEAFTEANKKIDFNQPKFQLQLQRANVSKEFSNNAKDKCVDIINSNFDNKEAAFDVIKFVEETINKKTYEFMGF